MDLSKHTHDKAILEKILLAYWYSIPGDNDRNPDTIKIRQDNGTFLTVDLFHDNIHYGMSTITKNELDRYLEKIKGLKEHELDVINRIEKEVDK